MKKWKNRWQIAPPISPEADQALSDYPRIFRKILFNRGYSTPENAQKYIDAQLPEGTNPFNMLGASEAVVRLEHAIDNQEPIAVYGDYDADGVTATALLYQTFHGLGAQVRGYIPHRRKDGYGLNTKALDMLYEEGTRLVVTVDCGIRALAEAEHAHRIGLDLIITDHHTPGEELPQSIAVINPKQPSDTYPVEDLAGVGVAYKLASALISRRREQGHEIPETLSDEYLLDLVALGTVADLVPLVGENRTLVRAGLKSIRQPHRQGLYALIATAGLRDKMTDIKASHIGFVLGPRINAAGRLDSALAAYELLTTEDKIVAGKLAQDLDKCNFERRKITRHIQVLAEELALTGEPDVCLLFAAHPDFNPGVVGLAASRLTELYYRPSVVGFQDEDYTRASCRSIPEFHITEALDKCADLLERYGGHAAAAGFTVHNDNLPDLVERLRTIAEGKLAGLDLRPNIQADAEVFLVDMEPSLLKSLDKMQPTGYGNPQAVFVTRELDIKRPKTVGMDGAHLKMVVSDERFTYDAIAFNQGDWINKIPPKVDIIYTFERNDFNTRFPYQFNVRDIKPSGIPD